MSVHDYGYTVPPGMVLCPECDGTGYLAHQWAKRAMLRCGGSIKRFSDGRPGVYYVDAECHEMSIKTIGGSCGHCQGKKFIPVQEVPK